MRLGRNCTGDRIAINGVFNGQIQNCARPRLSILCGLGENSHFGVTFPCVPVCVASRSVNTNKIPVPYVCWGAEVSCVAYRAQLGRLGGSRWGWVLQIKCRAIQTNVLSLPPEKIGAAMIRLADRLV